MRLDHKTIRHMMIDQDINQTQLSEASGVSLPVVNALCCGRACSQNTAEKIAEALDVPLEQLLEKRRQ